MATTTTAGLSARDAAAYLTARGYTCCYNTVRAVAQAGRLLGFRPGPTRRGPWSFTAEQLDAFLAAETGAGAAPPRPERRPRAPREKPARPVKAAGGASSWDRLAAEGGS